LRLPHHHHPITLPLNNSFNILIYIIIFHHSSIPF
jgi:hypothetical protein